MGKDRPVIYEVMWREREHAGDPEMSRWQDAWEALFSEPAPSLKKALEISGHSRLAVTHEFPEGRRVRISPFGDEISVLVKEGPHYDLEGYTCLWVEEDPCLNNPKAEHWKQAWRRLFNEDPPKVGDELRTVPHEDYYLLVYAKGRILQVSYDGYAIYLDNKMGEEAPNSDV
jgi:hypothetical protein